MTIIGLVKQLWNEYGNWHKYGNWEGLLQHYEPLIAAELQKPDSERFIDEFTAKMIEDIPDPHLFINAGAKV
jgi:hypothetical protein